MGEQENEGSVPRWGNWNQIDVEEKWRLLKELSFYFRRRPVRECTEELGAPPAGEEEGDFPEIEEGITERNIDLVDMSKEPKLTLEEWNRPKACGRPCSK